MVPRTSEVSQNGDPRTLNENENQQCPMTSTVAKKIYSKQCSLNFNANPANPFSLQISSQLVTRGAGGRGEALGSAAPGRRPDAGRLQSLYRFSPLQGSPEKESSPPAGYPCRRPLCHGNQNQGTWKCTPNFDCKMTALGHPKGPHRTAKIDQNPRKCALRRCLKGLRIRNWEK